MGGAELAERHQRVGNAPRRRYPAKVIERHECIERHERLQLAVQCTDDVDRVRAALLLGLYANRKLRRLLGDVVDLAGKILEDHLAHLLRFLDRAQLRRQEDQAVGPLGGQRLPARGDDLAAAAGIGAAVEARTKGSGMRLSGAV